MVETKNCIVCNKQFTTNKSQQICCSEECARERHKTLMRERYNPSYAAKKRGKVVYTKECIVCGKIFQTETKQRMMCSTECRKERDRIMRRNYQKNKKREQKRRKTRISELAMVERLAREHGLTYGKYVELYEYR